MKIDDYTCRMPSFLFVFNIIVIFEYCITPSGSVPECPHAILKSGDGIESQIMDMVIHSISSVLKF